MTLTIMDCHFQLGTGLSHLHPLPHVHPQVFFGRGGTSDLVRWWSGYDVGILVSDKPMKQFSQYSFNLL